jgi:hypothetical protein
MMKLKKIVEGFDREEGPSLSSEEKRAILGMISEYNSLGKSLKREGSLPDVANKLSKMAEAAQKITLSETDEWFDSQTIKKNMDGLKKASVEFNKLAKEAYVHEQRMTALYEDMGHILGRYFNIKDPIEEITQLSDLKESNK